MIQAERISFFQAERERKVEFNPEEDATNNLLEISNQEFDLLEQQVFFWLYRQMIYACKSKILTFQRRIQSWPNGYQWQKVSRNLTVTGERRALTSSQDRRFV
jgi:hypothetical protein